MLNLTHKNMSVKIKTLLTHRFGKAVKIGDVEICFGSDGHAELKQEEADKIFEILGSHSIEVIAGEKGNSSTSPKVSEDMIKKMKSMKLEELKEIAASQFPEEEWKDKLKPELIEYLTDKLKND